MSFIRFASLVVMYLTCFLFTNSALALDELASGYGAGLKFSLHKDASGLSLTLRSPHSISKQDGATTFYLGEPDRLVVDIPGLLLSNQGTASLETRWSSGIRVGKHSDKARIVLDLKTPVVGSPRLSQSSSKEVTVSFNVPEFPPQKSSYTEQARWIERPAKREPSVAQQASPARTQSGKVVAYSAKGDKTSIVQIEDSKSVSKVPAVKFNGTESKAAPAEMDVALSSEETEQEEEVFEEQTASLQQEKKRTKSGFSGQEMQENFINYNDIPPPLANPFGQDFTWAWQLALILTIICLFVVALKRASVMKAVSSDGEIVPWFDEEVLTLREMYSILGVSADCSNEEVKDRYRQLAKAFHSDKLSSQELPEEVIQLTEDQFKRVQNAYEMIKRERGID